MKKLIVIFTFAMFTIAMNAQYLFHEVTPAIFKVDKTLSLNKPTLKLTNGTTILAGVWEWKFDGTVNLAEVDYNKDTKTLVTNAVFGVGPAIGYQHYVPTSASDPTPFNNYGFGAGVLLGEKFKFVLQVNVMQYFKFGVTVTPHSDAGIIPVGGFVGAGITF